MTHDERFVQNVKNIESEKRARPKRREDRLADKKPAWDIGVGSDEKYAIGWERIFGKKTGDSIPRAGEESPAEARRLHDENPTADDSRGP